MVDIPSITAAITGLKTAAEIAKAMKGLHDLADVQTKVIELQGAILHAQTSALAAHSDPFTMMQKLHELEAEVRRVRAWEETKQRYQLITPCPGCHVYALKESHKNADPAHWICPHCYEEGRRSLLLVSGDHNRGAVQIIKCPHCDFSHETTSESETEPKYA